MCGLVSWKFPVSIPSGLLNIQPGELSWTALGYGLDDESQSWQGLGKFLFNTVFRPTLGSTQSPIQRVPGALSLRVKRPGREANQSPPYLLLGPRMRWAIPPLPQYAFTVWCSVKAQGQLYLYLLSGFSWLSSVCRGKWHNKDEGKIIPLLFFNWASHHEGVLEEWRYSSMHSLTSALDGGEWSASRPGRFKARERAPGTHWIWGWVGSRAGLDAAVKRKIPSPSRESNLRTPIVQPVFWNKQRPPH
jgi:hypothetical protein